MSDRFWNRLNKLYQQLEKNKSTGREVTPEMVRTIPVQESGGVEPRPPLPQQESTVPLTYARKMELIKQAGANPSAPFLIEMMYDGVTRLVEPYEFKETAPGIRFYGFCRLHGRIHQFNIDKIQALRVTDIPFGPQWPVQVAVTVEQAVDAFVKTYGR